VKLATAKEIALENEEVWKDLPFLERLERWDGDEGHYYYQRTVGWRDPTKPYWVLSIIRSWLNWDFSIGAQREIGTNHYPSRLWLTLSVGPFAFSAMRTWNERK
jgi:hypothetical protein